MARAKKSKTSVKVNFKGVESRRTPPEGDYICQVLEAKAGTSQGGNDQIEFTCEIAKGEYKGVKLWFYCPLQENSLWKLHAFLTVLGEEVPEDEMDIDLSDLAEREFVGVLTHETYQGKKRAKLTDFDSVENYKGGDDEDEDDDDKKSKGKKSKSKDEDDDDKKSSKSKGKSKKEEAPDYDDLDEDELRELYLERELGTKREAKGLDEDELREALEDADKAAAKKGKSKSKDDDDDDDDDKGKKGKNKKKPKKIDKSDVEDMDEEELQALIDEHDLDVDLDDYKKLSKKVAAVIEELDDKDLLDD